MKSNYNYKHAFVVFVVGIFAITLIPQTIIGGEKILRVGYASIKGDWDPKYGGGSALQSMAHQITENLIEPDALTLQPKGQLAESWTTSPNGLVWVFNLKKGVKFQDGTPFNADAVKWNFERILDKKPKPAARRYLYDKITEMEVLDDHTLKVVLSQPVGPFLWYLMHRSVAMQSPTQYKKLGPDRYRDQIVGTGPFMIKKIVPGSHIETVAFKDYWGGTPKIGGITFFEIADATARLQAVEAGDLDIALDIPYPDIPRIEKDPKIKLQKSLPTKLTQLIFNVSTQPALKDRRVRQALAYAIDRESIVKNIFFGKARLADSAVAKGIGGYQPIKNYSYDLGKAKKLMAEAGYSKGFDFDFVIVATNPEQTMQKVFLQAIQSYWAELGVNIKIQVRNRMFQTQMRNPDFKHTWHGWAVGISPATVDTGYSLKMMHYGPNAPPKVYNVGYYNNPALDKAIDDQELEADPVKRKKILFDALKICMEDVPAIYLWAAQQHHAVRSNVMGAHFPMYEQIKLRNVSFK